MADKEHTKIDKMTHGSNGSALVWPAFDTWLDCLGDRLADLKPWTIEDDFLQISIHAGQISFIMRDGARRSTQNGSTQNGVRDADQAAKINHILDETLSQLLRNAATAEGEDRWPVSPTCLSQFATLNAWLMNKQADGWSSIDWGGLSSAALQRAVRASPAWPSLADKGLHVVECWLTENRPTPENRLDDMVNLLLLRSQWGPASNLVTRWLRENTNQLKQSDSLASTVCRHNNNALWVRLLSDFGRSPAGLIKPTKAMTDGFLAAAARDLTDDQMADLAAGSNLIADHAVFRACLERRTLGTEAGEGVSVVRRRL